jgi:hypothetical protein
MEFNPINVNIGRSSMYVWQLVIKIHAMASLGMLSLTHKEA